MFIWGDTIYIYVCAGRVYKDIYVYSPITYIPVGFPKPDRSRPDEERCLGEENSDADSSDAGSGDIGNDLKHRVNDARDSYDPAIY